MAHSAGGMETALFSLLSSSDPFYDRTPWFKVGLAVEFCKKLSLIYSRLAVVSIPCFTSRNRRSNQSESSSTKKSESSINVASSRAPSPYGHDHWTGLNWQKGRVKLEFLVF